MAQLFGPSFIALQVRDITASERFYTERLGLRRATHSPANAVVFETQPVPFAIREPAVDLDAANRLGWGVALWFACDDADALHARLAAVGTPIVQQPFDGPFGRTFVFADPDGYLVTAHSKKE